LLVYYNVVTVEGCGPLNVLGRPNTPLEICNEVTRGTWSGWDDEHVIRNNSARQAKDNGTKIYMPHDSIKNDMKSEKNTDSERSELVRVREMRRHGDFMDTPTASKEAM